MANKVIQTLMNTMIIQSQITTPVEGHIVEMVMKRKNPASSFMMIEFVSIADEGKPDKVVDVEEFRVRRVPASCRRGTAEVDANGQPFAHMRPPETGVCIFCGDGQKPAPPEKPITEDRLETVMCAHHGFHKLIVHPDGSYDKPDCPMFKSEDA